MNYHDRDLLKYSDNSRAITMALQDPSFRLSHRDREYLEKTKRQWQAEQYYTVAFAWRNI